MSDGIRLTVRGMPEAQARVAALPQAVTKAMRQAMSRSLDIVYRRIADNLTGKVLRVQSGRLRQSIQTSMRIDGTMGRIGTNVDYAEIHEYGGKTAAHRIEARRKKALAFRTPGFIGPLRFTKKGELAKKQTAGAITYVRAVEHPGAVVPARPYMRPALAESREEIADLLRAGLAEALRVK